ncbi:hypothetical protein M0802_000405 [Mischocyttarus mexicanus]|nr:hypothetical protein M0802_000405 [Mischocyttarus mexicanus]
MNSGLESRCRITLSTMTKSCCRELMMKKVNGCWPCQSNRFFLLVQGLGCCCCRCCYQWCYQCVSDYGASTAVGVFRRNFNS